MDIFHHITTLRDTLRTVRQSGRSIAVVPTMGHLHRGHIALVEHAQTVADYVVATIFVNPMQFGHNEDLESYPRTLEADSAQLLQAGCHCLFAPATSEIYPDGLQLQTLVSVPDISQYHCGASRPGHFDGVSTVIAKLFNIVAPDKAVFGLKDYQQFQLIRKMVQDLCFPVEILGVETQRDEHGLALSSRNSYLDNEQKRTASLLYTVLRDTRDALQGGRQHSTDRSLPTDRYRALEEQARSRLSAAGLRTDYFNISNARTLEPPEPQDMELVILAAVFVGATRLIDNIQVSLS